MLLNEDSRPPETFAGRYENSRRTDQTPVVIGHWEMGTLRNLRE